MTVTTNIAAGPILMQNNMTKAQGCATDSRLTKIYFHQQILAFWHNSLLLFLFKIFEAALNNLALPTRVQGTERQAQAALAREKWPLLLCQKFRA